MVTDKLRRSAGGWWPAAFGLLARARLRHAECGADLVVTAVPGGPWLCTKFAGGEPTQFWLRVPGGPKAA